MMNRNAFFRDPVFREPIFRSLASLAGELDRACSAPVRPAAGPAARPVVRAGAPAMNIFATEDRLTIEAEVPGLALEDIEIVLHADELTIRATRVDAQPDGAGVLLRERPVGPFERSFTLPADIDSASAAASLEHGVLTITLPRSQAARPRRLPINGHTPAPAPDTGTPASTAAPDQSPSGTGPDPREN
jgi:HSP20 family protein